MGRKRSSETSPEYGSFIVIVVYHWIGLLYTEGKGLAHATSLETRLLTMMSIDEIRELVSLVHSKIISSSNDEWERGVRHYFSDLIESLLTLPAEQEQLSSIPALSEDEQIKTVLKLLGREDDVKDFFVFLKETFLRQIDIVINRDAQEVEKWLVDTIKGAFTDDSEYAIYMMRMATVAAGGEELINQMDEAIRQLHDKLLGSNEFSASVEAIEKPELRDGSHSDVHFKDSWTILGPRIMKRLVSKGLYLPRLEIPQGLIPENLSEEEMFAMERVLAELIFRATQKPIQLISDTFNGKLPNSIVLSVEHDIRDEIRKLNAQKMGGQNLLDIDEQNRISIGRQYSKENNIDLLDIITDHESEKEILALFTPVEREILRLNSSGYKKVEIAEKLGLSPGRITQIFSEIREKVKGYFDSAE